jgi:hypothetical protein
VRDVLRRQRQFAGNLTGSVAFGSQFQYPTLIRAQRFDDALASVS